MDRQKVITDWMIAVQDTIYILQVWLGLLESWRALGQAEADDFNEACQQLRDAGLWHWAADAGGHGLASLAQAIEVDFQHGAGPDDTV